MSATTNDNNNNDKNRPASERKMKALDIVSSRSLGSLASVQETFAKGRKQRLTGRVVFAVFVGAIAGILFGFDQNIFNMIISEPDFRESMGMPQAVNACETEGAKEPAWVATQLGFIMSLYPLGCAFAAPFAGAINDRFGRYKTLWMGMVSPTVPAHLSPRSPNPKPLSGARADSEFFSSSFSLWARPSRPPPTATRC